MARITGTDNGLLEAALIGYQQQHATVSARIAELQKLLNGRATNAVSEPSVGGRKQKRHRISAEGRARIAAAQKKRWAAAKAAK